MRGARDTSFALDELKKLAQYEQGERFIETIERAGGPDYLERAFESPDELPTLAEIREPDEWMRRVRPIALAAGS